jgi:hypothetical protein
VTLSDEEAKRRGTQKSILERKAYPAFEIVIEINNPTSWIIHENVKMSVDKLLRQTTIFNQIRKFNVGENLQIKYYSNLLFKPSLPVTLSLAQNLKNWNQRNNENYYHFQFSLSKAIKIYPYSISSNFLREVFRKLGLDFIITNDIKKAHIIIGLKNRLQQNLKLKKLAKQKKIPIYSFNQLSLYQLTKFIKFIC